MRHIVPFLLALFLLALVLRVPLFFTVVYFMVGLYLLSRLWVRHSVRHVEVGRRFTPRAFTGDTTPVTVTVRNTSRLPVPWVQVEESVPVGLVRQPVPARVMTLGWREEQRFSYQLDCRKRGYYELGPFFLAVGDLVGAEQQRLRRRDLDHLLIYPRVVPIDRLGLRALAVQPVLATPSRLVEDPARILGVRDYRRGDSPRRIHWNASARQSRLLVKQYEPAIARETMIFLDLNQEAYVSGYGDAPVELAIVAAASLANHIIGRERLPVGLAVEASDGAAERVVRRFVLPPRPERGQLLAILEVLARVQPVYGGSFAGDIRRQSVSLPWGATVVAITGTPDEAVLETLLYLRRGGFAVSLVLVAPDSRDYPSAPAGVPVHLVHDEQDIEAWH